MKFIDTHSHVNSKEFNEDADQVILGSLEDDIGIVIVGSNYKSSKKAIDLANKHENGVYATVGLHPSYLEDVVEKRDDGREVIREVREEFNYESFLKLAQFEKVVAIGEIGLDYYRLKIDDKLDDIKQRQREIFVAQLDIAVKLDLPVIIHCRQAHDDLLKILQEFKEENKNLISKDKPWGVVHCFSGDENLAWKYFDLGLLVSFTGIITFSKEWDDFIRKMPLDKLMIETDCPYLTPEPHRGERNTPLFVPFVAERIAEIRGVDIEEIARITTNNAEKFFQIQ